MVASTPRQARERPLSITAVVVPVGLWILAIAQPVFEVMLEHPPFLTVHRMTVGKLAWFATVAGVLLPIPVALVAAAAAAWRKRAGEWLLAAVTGLATAAIFLQLVSIDSSLAGVLLAVSSATVGAVAFGLWP